MYGTGRASDISRETQYRVSSGREARLVVIIAGSLLVLLLTGELAFQQMRSRGHHHLSIGEGLMSLDVIAIAKGVDQKLWVEHQSTLLQYWGTSDSFITRQNELNTTGIEHIVFAPDGEVWASARFPFLLNHFDGEQWNQIIVEDEVSNELQAMAASPTGDVWFVTNEELIQFNGLSWQYFLFPERLVVDGSAAAAPAAGGIWFAGRYLSSENAAPGLVHFDGQTWEFFANDVGPFGIVNTINIDNKGTVWVGTQHGLFRYDGQEWLRYTSEDGLLADQILSIAFGLDGMVWVGTEKGISGYDGLEWRSLIPLTPNCWADDLVVDESNTIYFVVDHCSRLFGLDQAREDGLRFYDTRRTLVSTELIKGWHSIRFGLMLALVLCLGTIGQQRSQIPTTSRLKISIGVSAFTCAICIFAISLAGSIILGPCQPNGLLLLFPAWFAASTLTTAASLFVGFMQQDDTKVTAVTAVLAGVFFSAIISYQVVTLVCNVG